MKIRLKTGLTIIAGFILLKAAAQPLGKKSIFTRADTIRGTITPERAWWNVLHYDITVKPDFLSKTIQGINIMRFKTLHNGDIMQIDLQEPMTIDSIILTSANTAPDKGNKKLNFKKDGNVNYVYFDRPLTSQSDNQLAVYYHGKPREAINPPWDGGWIWKKDKKQAPWMSAACQGLGASVWYPCKDIQSDEPDSGATLHIIVPDSLVGVGNGRLSGKRSLGNETTLYTWNVKNPINNYNIIPYIGKYVHFSEVYVGEKGNLDLDYWVLEDNLEKAKKQFSDVPKMMKAFEYWFGPYPFYEDGYKLVQSPHLGMEHQSAVAYGNGFQNGYLGKDLSGSGWGLKWDFIIIHESGHEWFANNITTNDIADMWVHEGLTNYSETLFTEYYYGKEAATAYISGIRKTIQNDIPIIGHYGVNKEGSGDMYNKGANMIHNIRQVINDDSLFRRILRDLNKVFYHQTISGRQLEEYISNQSGIDFSKVFDQYLRTIQIPTLEYKISENKLSYRYTTCIKGFNMPLKINSKKEQWIKPTEEWQTIKLNPADGAKFSIDPGFYIIAKKVN